MAIGKKLRCVLRSNMQHVRSVKQKNLLRKSCGNKLLLYVLHEKNDRWQPDEKKGY